MMLKKYSIKLILILLILASLSVGCNFGIWGKNRGSISGKILDSSNSPITEAKVTTFPATIIMTTNKNGYFNIDNVEKGDYTVTITKAGYTTKTTSCRLDGGASFSCWGSSNNTYVEIHLTLN